MKKFRKELLLGFLIAMLGLIALLPVGKVEAASGDNWTMDSSTGTLTITGDGFQISNTSMADFKEEVLKVVIKSGVTNLGDKAFSGCTNLTSVSIPNTITNIPISCFNSCSSLKKITLPSSITVINEFAFSGCTSLTSVNIPDSVNRIWHYAFEDCSALQTITIPEGITYLDGHCFYGCTSLTSVTIPSSVTSLGDDVFHGCTSLTSISTLENVKSIGGSVFQNCSSLTSIELGQELSSIPATTFYGCTSLKTIILPVSVTSVGQYAFKGCSALEDLVVLNPDASFYNTGLDNSVTVIHCFEYSKAHSYAKENDFTYHFLNEGVVTSKATTTSYGEMKYTCATCGNTYTQEIQPLELGVSNVTSVTVSGSGFKVKWSKVSGASGYKLYRKTANGDYVLAKKTSSTSYTDSGLTAGTKYTYVVKAYNSVQTADEGTSMSYTFIKKTSISSLTSTSKGVKIKWKAVSGAKNYVIYRNGTKVTTTTSTSYVDTGATTNGKAYKYYILTYVDSSSYSKSAVKKTYYLKTQAISSAVNKSGKKIQVKYSKNNRATGYQIQYSTSSKFTSSKTTTKKVTSYKTVSKTLTKLTKNKTYYVRVRSYKKVSDAVYYGAWSAKKKVKVTK